MIKIQLDEYEYLMRETDKIHKEMLLLIQNYIKELDDLLIPSGGFHADMISGKVKLILDAFRGQVVPRLEKSFSDTERQIQVWGQRIGNLDESGRRKVQWEE